jgi:hypothetical protein
MSDFGFAISDLQFRNFPFNFFSKHPLNSKQFRGLFILAL